LIESILFFFDKQSSEFTFMKPCNLKWGLCMLCLNVTFSSLSNVLQKALFDVGMSLMAYQFLSSVSTCVINYILLKRNHVRDWKLISLVAIIYFQYVTLNIALLIGEPGLLMAILTGITLCSGTLFGVYFFKETILPIPYGISISLIAFGLFMTTQAGALSFGCFFMTALSSLGYTAFSAFQRFYSPDCISTNFYFRLIVILTCAPIYFLTETLRFPSLYEWCILGILGLVNLLYMICFLQGAEVLDVHVVMIFTGLRTPLSYVFQFIVLSVLPNYIEAIGATAMFIAVTMYPMFKYIQFKQTLTGGCTYKESRPLLLRAETPEFTTWAKSGTPPVISLGDIAQEEDSQQCYIEFENSNRSPRRG